MNVFFICYNYLTLYKAIYNIDKYHKNDNCLIIYRNTVSSIKSKKIKNKYNLIEINDINFPNKKMQVFSQVYVTYKINRLLKKHIKNIRNAKLVVFKDNDLIESTIIDRFLRLTKRKGTVVLIEEGLGLYEKKQKGKIRISGKMIVFQKIFRLSNYFLYYLPQGFNPKVNIVICNDRKKFLEKNNRKGLIVQEQKNIFTREKTRYFLEDLLSYDLEKINFREIKLVYLTQPLSGKERENINEWNIIKLLTECSQKKLLIKRHPRDYNVNHSSNKNVFELPKKYNSIPFECLYTLMDDPIIITYYSSAYKNLLNENKSAKILLLYKLLNNHRINKLMDGVEKNNDYENLYIPHSIVDLKRITLKLVK